MNREKFHAVVVGSGFGGSVMAFRLAHEGKEVCVLERGKAYMPGSFPRSPTQMKQAFWDPSEGRYGLFDFWSFQGTDILISSGLAGGSLIYANVLLEKDPSSFADWPISYPDLQTHYASIKKTLGGNPYPFSDCTPKTRVMKETAEKMEMPFALPDLAVSFGKSPSNPEPLPIEDSAHDQPVHRQGCRLCGECIIGCNFGSKNTLDFNYLAQAKKNGAVLRTLCEVREFEPLASGGYVVRYVMHEPEVWEGLEHNTSQLPLHEIECEKLILAAGTIGSTFLLLKMQEMQKIKIGPALGTRFSGNGDMIAVAAECTENGKFRSLEPFTGPTITSTVFGSTDRRFYIEDWGYNFAYAWMLFSLDIPDLLTRAVRFISRYLRSAAGLSSDAKLSAEANDFVQSEKIAASLPFVAMGEDEADGKMYLIKNALNEYRLQLDFSRQGGSLKFYEDLERTMELFARNMGAKRFKDNPTWYLNRTISVHPLGGCPMGIDPGNSVVGTTGEVHGYPGLYVADGSVIPNSIGPNPSLTIAAVAHYFADQM